MSATTVLDVAAVDAEELAVACEDAATYEHAVFVVGVRAGVAGIIVGIVGFGDVWRCFPFPHLFLLSPGCPLPPCCQLDLLTSLPRPAGASIHAL